MAVLGKIIHTRLNLKSECRSGISLRSFHNLIHTKKILFTKLGTTNNFLLLQQKILLQQPNVLLVELKMLFL